MGFWAVLAGVTPGESLKGDIERNTWWVSGQFEAALSWVARTPDHLEGLLVRFFDPGAWGGPSQTIGSW